LAARAPAPEEIVGLLADPTRRRLVAVLVASARDRDQLLESAGVPPRAALEQLSRLERAGLVVEEGGRYRLVEDIFERSVRDAAVLRLGSGSDADTQLVRRYFFRNRLVQIPSEAWALEVVLDLIAQDFQPGDIYNEREVNTTLYGWHGDWATLRRLLVDGGYLARDHGRYWRKTSATSL
jgi:hypothetical protein